MNDILYIFHGGIHIQNGAAQPSLDVNRARKTFSWKACHNIVHNSWVSEYQKARFPSKSLSKMDNFKQRTPPLPWVFPTMNCGLTLTFFFLRDLVAGDSPVFSSLGTSKAPLSPPPPAASVSLATSSDTWEAASDFLGDFLGDFFGDFLVSCVWSGFSTCVVTWSCGKKL